VPDKAKAHSIVLSENEVALVGSQPITVQTVAQVQQQSALNGDEALETIVDAHLLGLWAANGGLSLGRRQTAERGLLARVLLEKVQAQVQQPPMPSDAEVVEATQARWVELDRPEARRIAHFVVTTSGTSEALAQAQAQRIALFVKGVTKAEDFIEKARSVPSVGFKVVAELLPPVTADGRTFQIDPSGKPTAEGGIFDRDFAQAASRLDVPGTQSGIVHTSFGFHVLLLVARVTGYTMPIGERRVVLWPEILRRRAQRVTDRMLDERRRATVPQTDRAALEWMGHVKVSQ
jgi:parvulin-like peptidyl-prolyl isomerase